MIPPKIKDELLKNWGEKADAMDCYCEVKFIDPLTDWACYIYALNPVDENEIACIVTDHDPVEAYDWTLDGLSHCYNREGDYPIIDKEFRRIKASELFKKLNHGKYDPRRN